jgi:hypothetical protein
LGQKPRGSSGGEDTRKVKKSAGVEQRRKKFLKRN